MILMRPLACLQITLFCLFSIVLSAEELPLIRLCAESDTAYYTSFATALFNANKQKSASMQLLGDVRFDGRAAVQTVKTNLTLDLNGYSLGDTLTGTSLLTLSIDTLRLHVFSSHPGGRIWCTRPYNGRIYALQCTKGHLSLDHVTIETTNTSDTLLKASACGVNIGKTASLHMSDCVVLTSARTGAYGVNTYDDVSIERCRIEVQADSTNAYGIYLNRDTALLEKEAHVVHTTMRIKALQKAYGLLSYGTVALHRDSIFTQSVLNDSYAFYSGKSYARGEASQCVFCAEAGTITCSGANISGGGFFAEDCMFRGTSRMERYQEITSGNTRGIAAGTNTSLALRRCLLDARGKNLPMTKTVSGLAGNATTQLVMEDCEIHVEGNETTYGISSGSRMEIQNCKISVQAAGNVAYGISITNYHDDVQHQDATAVIRRTKVTLSALKQGYGICARSPLLLTRDTANVIVSTQTGYGLYINNDSALFQLSQSVFTSEAGLSSAYGIYMNRGTMIAEDCDLQAESKEQVRALFAAGSSTSVSVITCRRCRMRAQGETKANGALLTSTGVLDSCRIEAVASGSEAYALYANTGCDTLLLNGCYLKAQAAEKGLVVNANTKTEGLLWLYGGYYSDNVYIAKYMPAGYAVYRLSEEERPEAGYPYAIRPIADPGVVVARLYNNSDHSLIREFRSLAEGLRYIQFNEGDMTLVVVASCRLSGPATYYIPDYARMTVAYMDDQTDVIGEEAAYSATPYYNRKEYARVEVSDSVNLVVEGMLEVSAVLQDEGAAVGTVCGEFGYGRIDLAPTASIELEPGAKMQAWGYVTGSGTVTAQSGATVRECLQLGDWKGGSVSYEMMNNAQKVFPITHFFYQNIECPVIYLPGSRALGATFIKISTFSVPFNDLRLIDSEQALFVMHESDEADVFIRKEYDPVTDRIVWTTSGDISLEELDIKTDIAIGRAYNLLSERYLLPLGSNTTIRVHSGMLRPLHDVALLPGCVVEIAPDAQMDIPVDVNLCLYDEQQWGTYAGKRYSTVTYSPSWRVCPRDTLLLSARMIVGGAVRIEGSLYTTESGADIVGNEEDAGQVIFVNGAADQRMTYQLTGVPEAHQFTSYAAINAALRNADGSLTHTAQAVNGDLFTYSNGRWESEKGGTVDTELTRQTVLMKAQLIMRNNNLYVRTQDGALYTLLGNSVRKEDL
jgi:hypothetical protein